MDKKCLKFSGVIEYVKLTTKVSNSYMSSHGPGYCNILIYFYTLLQRKNYLNMQTVAYFTSFDLVVSPKLHEIVAMQYDRVM